MNLEEMMNNMNQKMASEDAFKKPTNNNFNDERIYKISKDKDGNGSVVVRFLPSWNLAHNDIQTFVTKKFHSINTQRIVGDKVEKKWSGNLLCPTMHGDDCLICNYGWDNYKEAKDEYGKDDKRTKAFLKFTSNEKILSNILIIKDDINPSNNGKVFAIEYGNQIAKIIQKQMHPTPEEIEHKGAEIFNAWDMVGGKNFVLKLKDKKFTDNGFPSWEESFFVGERSTIASSSEEINTFLDMTHQLDDFIKPELIPTPEKLQEKLDEVLFIKTSKPKQGMPETTGSQEPTEQKFDPTQFKQAETQVSQVTEVAQPKEEATPVQEEKQEVPVSTVTETKEAPKEPASGTLNMDDFLNQFKK